MRILFLFLFTCSLLLGIADCAFAQVEILRGIYRMNRAVGAREVRQDRAREAKELEEQQKENVEIDAQRRQIQQAPGSFPRQRWSHEAALSNNPWARQAQKQAGAMPVIEVFVAESCPDCNRMEEYLNDVGVPYRLSILTPGSEEEQRYLAQIGRGMLPVVRVNDKIVRGYKPEDVRHAILGEKPR